MIKTDFIPFGKNKYSPIGIDIGSTSVKMAQLRKTAAGWRISDMCMKVIPFSESENGADRKDLIIQAIKSIMKEASFSGKSVVSVMPGYQLDIFPVKLSLSEAESLEDAVLEEAVARLSYDVEEAVIDYIPVENNGSGSEEKNVRSLLMAARREDVDEHLSILKGAKLKPLALDISACALARLLRFSGSDNIKNELLINAGYMHTTITVLWQNNILLDRSILWGTENIVESIMNRLKLDQQKASDLLHRIGMRFRHGEEQAPASDGSDYMHKIAETVYEIAAPQLEKLAREIDKVMQYFSSEMRGADIDTLYLSGSVSRIKELDTYLGERTGIRTKIFDPLKELKTGENGNSKYQNGFPSSFGVALGLAMRGFENQVVKPERK
jgi:type IV pilus assembly protein PilM